MRQILQISCHCHLLKAKFTRKLPYWIVFIRLLDGGMVFASPNIAPGCEPCRLPLLQRKTNPGPEILFVRKTDA